VLEVFQPFLAFAESQQNNAEPMHIMDIVGLLFQQGTILFFGLVKLAFALGDLREIEGNGALLFTLREWILHHLSRLSATGETGGEHQGKTE